MNTSAIGSFALGLITGVANAYLVREGQRRSLVSIQNDQSGYTFGCAPHLAGTLLPPFISVGVIFLGAYSNEVNAWMIGHEIGLQIPLIFPTLSLRRR